MTLSRADSAQTRLMALTATVVAVVWAAMALFALAAARDSFVETHTATAQTIARATAYDVAAAMAADRMALDAAVARVLERDVPRLAADLPAVWSISVADGAGHPIGQRAAVTRAEAPPDPLAVVAPILSAGAEVGRVSVVYAGPAVEADLQDLLSTLLIGLLIAVWTATEFVGWSAGRRLSIPAVHAAREARRVAEGDFRRALRPAGGDELGDLTVALGRSVRHVVRRLRELEWATDEARREAFTEGEAARVSRLLEGARHGLVFETGDPVPTEPPLERALRRLSAGFVGALGLYVSVAARDALGGDVYAWLTAAVVFVAAALLVPRLLDGAVQKTGPRTAAVVVALAATASLLVLPFDAGAALMQVAGTGLAAGIALHAAGGVYALPVGADGTRRDVGVLAGAVAGIGIAAGILIVAGPDLRDRIVPTAAIVLALQAAATVALAPAGLDRLRRATWPSPSEIGAAFRSGRRATALIGLTAPAAAILSAGLMFAGPLGTGPAGVVAWATGASVGAWAAFLLPAGPWIAVILRTAAAAALLVGSGGLIDEATAAGIGFAATLAFATAVRATQAVAVEDRTAVGTQRLLLVAAAVRALAFALPPAVAVTATDWSWLPALLAAWIVAGGVLAGLLGLDGRPRGREG